MALWPAGTFGESCGMSRRDSGGEAHVEEGLELGVAGSQILR